MRSSYYVLIATLLILYTFTATAFEAIPADDLFKEPNIHSMSLSPKGEYILEVGQTNFHRTLTLIDTSNYKKYLISKKAINNSAKITNYTWLDNNTIYVAEEDSNHIITVDKSKPQISVNWESISVAGFILSKKIDKNGEIIFAKTSGDWGQFYQVYQITLTQLLDNDFNFLQSYGVSLSNAVNFYLDERSQILMALTYEGGEAQVSYLPPDDTFWSTLHQFEIEEKFIPLAFIDENSLAVLTNVDSNYTYLAQFDIKSQALTKILYKSESSDLNNATLSKDGLVHSVSYIKRGVNHTEYFSPVTKTLQKKLSGKLKDRQISIIDTDQSGDLSLTLAYASNTPGSLYLFNKRTSKLKKLGLIRNNLQDYRLAKAEVFNVKVTDELEIEGIVTRPSVASNGVLLVNPHGGPIGIRDNANFNLENQFYASRGYTILNVNFRGSTGFGKAFEDQGRGQFGQLIEQDIMAVYQQFAKENKFDYTCSMGASYGGYSAVMLAIKHPNIFKCAISVFGVFDLPHLFNATNVRLTPKYHKALRKVMGDDMAQLSEISPLKLAHKLQAPVLIMAGEKDNVAPFEQSYRMKYTLEKLDKIVEFHAYADAGHGHNNWSGDILQHEAIHKFIQNSQDDFYTILQAFKLKDLKLIQSRLTGFKNINKKHINGYSLLHYAVELDDPDFAINVANILIKKGINIDLQDDYLRTPLSLATIMNRESQVEHLLNKGANADIADKSKETPLYIAADFGLNYITKLLLKHSKHINHISTWGLTPLMKASQKGDLDIVKLLVEGGANVHTQSSNRSKKTALDYAEAKNHTDIVSYLAPIVENTIDLEQVFTTLTEKLKSDDVTSALKLIPLLPNINATDINGHTTAHYAIKYNNEEDCLAVLTELIENDADINIQNFRQRSPLYIAVTKKRAKVTKLLLENGADINQRGYKQWTPFIRAISQGSLDLVKMMLNYPIDLTVTTTGAGWPTFLYITNNSHKGKDEEQAEIAKLLIEKGADIEVRTRSGRTALMNAASNGKFEVLKVLIAAGADINAINTKDKNNTPLDYAIEDGHQDIEDYLRAVLSKLKN